MAGFDVGLVCQNGHEINRCAATEPHRNEKHCSQCGEPAIDKCPTCDAPIRGFDHSRVVTYWRPPHHCHECGGPYPWTERRSDALAEAIDALDALNQEEREQLKKSIPDILVETPKSEVAALRFKKAAAKVGSAGGKMLSNVLGKVAADVVRTSLGL